MNSIHLRSALAGVIVMLLGLQVACAESPHIKQINTFLKAHANAIPLIVIKDGKGDFSNWERSNAKVIDGDHVHVPKSKPRTEHIAS